MRARPREAGGDLLRHLERGYVRSGSRSRRASRGGKRDPGHAPRHRRALPVHGDVRRHGNGLGRHLAAIPRPLPRPFPWTAANVSCGFPGAKITGADIADQMLEYARSTAKAYQLDIDYKHADAERLPFADSSFDGVISTFGVMFVGKPEAAAAELARVVKPGGRLALATWKHDSNLFHMFGVMKKFMPA